MTPDDLAKLGELAPPLQRRLRALLADCPHPVGITSGRRDRAAQQRLYDLWRAGKGAPANRPGTSRHELGLAADLRTTAKARSWCHANAARYGLRYPFAGEPWHVEPVAGAHPLDAEPAPIPDPDDDEDDMTPEQVRAIVRAELDRAVVLLTKGDSPDPKTGDTHPDNIGRLRTELRELRQLVEARPAP